MRHAEHATFGGSNLDRADDIRADADAIDAAVAHGRAEVLVLWQGKPLLAAGGLDRVICVPPDHPVLARHAGPRVLLGRDEAGRLILSQDISDWVPPGNGEGSGDAPPGGVSEAAGDVHPDLPAGSAFADLRQVMTRLSPRDAELAATARALFCWHETHGYCARCGVQSRMIHAGWQRRCDACGARHFPRTDPVVIMLVTHGNDVLVGRSPHFPAGMYSLLAGFVEPGETIEAAVRREVWEEAGVRIGQVGYLASQPWPFPASLMLGCHAEALSHEITIDPAEIEDARWMSREAMLGAFTGETPELLPARRGAIAHFLLQNWLADRLD
ncbi:MAG: NAD(+) diphosphatase [Roseovarius sp.]